MMSKIDLTIQIVTFNSAEEIIDCLGSIFKNKTTHSYEVIVFDNNSTDETTSVVMEKFPNLKLIKNNDNIGFGKAHNKISEQAKGDFLLILNPDTVLLPTSIDDFFKEQKSLNTEILAPKLRFEDGRIQPSINRHYPNLISHVLLYNYLITAIIHKIRPNYDYMLITSDLEKVQEVAWAMGAAILIKKSLFINLGGFDEKFFLYFEETDLMKRAFEKNKKLYYSPYVEVIHHLSASIKEKEFGQGSPFFMHSAYIFLSKNKGKAYSKIAYITTVLQAIINIIPLKILSVLYRLNGKSGLYLKSGIKFNNRVLNWHLNASNWRSF